MCSSIISILYYSSHLPLNYISHFDLVGIVNNELIGASAIFALLHHFAKRNYYVFVDGDGLLGVWVLTADCMGAVGAFGKTVGVTVAVLELLRVAESDFADDEEADAAGEVRAAIATGFSGKVCKVDTFSECVTCLGSFRRRNSQPVGQDAHKVRES
jgi:hypothetical protein